MRTIVPGHQYYLNNFEGPGKQILNFIQKEERDGKFVTVNNGTTNEEVIEALLDRLDFLDTKAPHQENRIAIEHLKSALAALNRRTEERKKRGVEGTPAK
jgi:hypothetical protein